MSKRKISVYVDGENLVTEHFSGIGHYTADLLKALDELIEKEHDVKVSIFSYFRRRPWLGRFGFSNFRFRSLPSPLRVNNTLKIRGWQPPIELLYGKKLYLYPNYSSWPMLFSRSIPFVYDLSFVFHPEFVAGPNQRFLVEQVQKSIKRATKILTISKNSKKEIVEHYGVDPKDVFICYPAVDTRNFYRRSNEEIARVKAKYGVMDDYIMFLGNLEPRKNLNGLLDAYKQLPAKLRKKHALLLVGAKGWNDDEIHDLIVRLRIQGERIIQPVDYVKDEDRPALYSGASAFVYPSHYEGFGIPPLEAMACGTPVVCADNSSLPEVAGDAAMMVKANDSSSIAKGLKNILSNAELVKRLTKKGYRQADKFTWEKSAQILLEQIRSIG